MRKLRRAQLRRKMWWTADSPINKPIIPNPTLDPDNDAIINYFATHPGGTMDCTLWGAPIYFATSSTPRVHVAHGSKLDPVYGALPTDGWLVPIDPSWWPASENDGHISIIDTDGLEYSFWQFQNGVSPSANGASIVDTRSSIITSGYGSATATCFGRAVGMVRVEEWERGYIDHAIFMATSLTRPGNPPPYQFPALDSDGRNVAGAPVNATLIEGARMQLDPAYNVDAKTNWRPWHRIVAKALQTYGMYVGDSSGNICGMLGEIPQTTTGSGMSVKHNNQTMYDLGIDDTYSGLPVDFPWASMRVLAAWDDSAPISALPKLASIKDNFPGPGLNRSFVWRKTNCVAVGVDTNHRVVIPQTASYTNALVSGDLDCTATSVYARIIPALGGNGTYTTSMLIRLDGDNNAGFSIVGNNLIFGAKNAGISTNTTVGIYSAVQHAWLRIRESGGVMYGDTSPDGATWTQRAFVAYEWSAARATLFISTGFWGTENPADSYVSYVNCTN